MNRSLAAALAALVVLAVPQTVLAFTFESVASTGCHERITLKALEQARWPVPAPASTEDDVTLAANLPFSVPAGIDLWTMSLLVGVRDNDLHGYALSDLPELSGIHNGEHTQDEHCLRSLSDDGAAGDRSALGSCRGFILSEVAKALAEDPGTLEQVPVSLRFQRSSIPLGQYAFHLGRACHALQDSFAHSFRSADQHQVLSVLNYIGPAVLQRYDEALGGHRHLATQDECGETDPRARARVEGAIAASAALLSAAAEPGDSKARLARASEALDGWVGYRAGCTGVNDWCGNGEPEPRGCSTTATGPCGLLALLVLGAARQRSAGSGLRGAAPKRSAGSRGLRVLSRAGFRFVGLLIASVGLAMPAQAQEAPRVEVTQQGVPSVELTAPATVTAAPTGGDTLTGAPAFPSRWSLHLGSGVAIDRGEANLTVGGQVALSRRFTLGLDGEYSPWFDALSGTTAAGTIDLYLTLGVTWVSVGILDVRSAVEVGASALLFNAPGARAGSIGALVGVSPLRLEVRLSPRVKLELSPEIVISAPSLRGVPLAYRQYRACIGLRWSI